MIEIAIPGFGAFKLRSAAMDFNGVLGLDGELMPGVAERLRELASLLHLYVLTADTYGTVHAAMDGLPVDLRIVKTGPNLPREDEAKRTATVGMQRDVVYIGNGYNDRLAMEVSQLSILVIGPDGASVEAMEHADLVVTDVTHALDMLRHPNRLRASLRR